MARRWLYFAALRIAQSTAVRPWFEAKKKKDKDRGRGAVVAIMRKLALVVHATVTNDEAFQLGRLLPGKPFVKPAIVAAVNKGENKNSKTVATDAISQQSPQAEFKKAELKKAELKKEEIKKEDRVPSPRSKVRLRTSRAIFPLPT